MKARHELAAEMGKLNRLLAEGEKAGLPRSQMDRVYGAREALYWAFTNYPSSEPSLLFGQNFDKAS